MRRNNRSDSDLRAVTSNAPFGRKTRQIIFWKKRSDERRALTLPHYPCRSFHHSRTRLRGEESAQKANRTKNPCRFLLWPVPLRIGLRPFREPAPVGTQHLWHGHSRGRPWIESRTPSPPGRHCGVAIGCSAHKVQWLEDSSRVGTRAAPVTGSPTALGHPRAW